MNDRRKHYGIQFSTTLLSTGLIVAVDPLLAADDAVTALTEPSSEATGGFGYISKDNLRFGEYTG
jgi:hypothetical protein